MKSRLAQFSTKTRSTRHGGAPGFVLP
jgi:hypothetical protein